MTEPASSEDVQRALEGILQDGDTFLVRQEEGTVWVEPPSITLPHERSPLQATHPDLYGYLLAASQRVTDASGCGLLLVVMIPILAVCFGLHSQAFHGFVADDPGAQRVLDGLASWWAYVILAVIGMGFYAHIERLFETQVYQRERDGLRDKIASSQVEVYTLIGLVEGDSGLDTISTHLKRDTELASGF